MRSVRIQLFFAYPSLFASAFPWMFSESHEEGPRQPPCALRCQDASPLPVVSWRPDEEEAVKQAPARGRTAHCLSRRREVAHHIGVSELEDAPRLPPSAHRADDRRRKTGPRDRTHSPIRRYSPGTSTCRPSWATSDACADAAAEVCGTRRRSSPEASAFRPSRGTDDGCANAMAEVCGTWHEEPLPAANEIDLEIERTMKEIAALEMQAKLAEHAVRDDNVVTPVVHLPPRERLVKIEPPETPKIARVPKDAVLDQKYVQKRRELVDPIPYVRDYLDKTCMPKPTKPETYWVPLDSPDLPNLRGDIMEGSIETMSVDPLWEHIKSLCHPY